MQVKLKSNKIRNFVKNRSNRIKIVLHFNLQHHHSSHYKRKQNAHDDDPSRPTATVSLKQNKLTLRASILFVFGWLVGGWSYERSPWNQYWLFVSCYITVVKKSKEKLHSNE